MLLEKKKKNTFVAENAENSEGEMLEWLKRHAWKACIRQKRIRGSNPCLSAERQLLGCFFVFMEGDASDVVKRKRERFLSVY